MSRPLMPMFVDGINSLWQYVIGMKRPTQDFEVYFLKHPDDFMIIHVWDKGLAITMEDNRTPEQYFAELSPDCRIIYMGWLSESNTTGADQQSVKGLIAHYGDKRTAKPIEIEISVKNLRGWT